jgi:hypothetical protein
MALAEDLLRSGYDEGDIKRMGLGAGFTALIALGFIPGVKVAADVAKRTIKEGVTSGAEELTTQTARAFGVGPDKQKNLITDERQKQLDAAAKLPANERRAFLKAANRPTPKIFHAQPTHGLDTEIQHGNQFVIAIEEMDASRKKFLENNKYVIFRYDEGTDDTNLNIPLSAFEGRVQDDGRLSPAFGEGIEESTLVSGTDEGVFRRQEERDVFARREGDAFKVFLGYRLAGDVGPTSVTEEVMLPIRKNADGEDAIFYSDFEDVIAQSVEERKNALPSYEDMGYTYPTKAEQLEAEGFMAFDEYRKAGGEKGRHSELDMFAISTARDPSVAMKGGFADRDLGNVLVADYPIERPIADMPPELYARAYGEGPIGMSRGELIAAAARERAGISLPKSVHLESEIAFQNPEDLDLRRLSTEPKIVDEPLDEVVSTYGRTPTLESAADLRPLADITRGKPINRKARAVLRARQREAFESPEYTFDTRLQSGTTGQRSSPESFSVADMRGSDIESTRRRVIASQATFNQVNENINSLSAQGVSLRKTGDQLSVPYNDETLGDAMQIREATRFYDDYLQNLNDIFKLGQYTEQYGARGGVDNALDRIFNADIRGGLFGASRILPPGEKRNLMDTLFQISKERANVSFTSPDSRATMTTRNISDRVLADALLRHKPRSNFSAEELSQLEKSGIQVEGGVRGRPNISINMYGTHRMGHRDIKRIIELASRSMNEGGLVDRSEMTPEQRKEEFVEGMKQTADLATDIAPVVSTAKGIAELPEDLRTIRDLVYAGVEERDPKKVGMGVMYAGLTGAGMLPGVRVGAKAAKKSIRQVANKEYDEIFSQLDELETPEEWQAAAKTLVSEDRDATGRSVVRRTPELEQSARDLIDNKILTREQHLKNVAENKPITEWTELPRQPSSKATVFALKPTQRENGLFLLSEKDADKLGVKRTTLKDGDMFHGRLDIPAYQSYDTWIVAGTSPAVKTADGKGVTTYAKAIHYKSGDNKPVKFIASQKTSEGIGKGEQPKTGYATISGRYKDTSEENLRDMAEKLLDDPEWSQVGFDPRRLGTFYLRRATDKHDIGSVVTEADEVIQIGPLVLAKNVKIDPDYEGYKRGGLMSRR